ncbi:hypothetical protein MAPG_05129 [Magnaporthiopsis poae ATCC 64411]|uniref:Uncharacterized protein n=1 Tax=Magnaporthiopsis poae (strain ATCC 64411 / 73-15) TaxID=644358 RepID=A0A0C4DYK7_MAGP6|nr:hypothetical protein MAPG_05129 [Magnaporthiopsis poae ATCC 64411]
MNGYLQQRHLGLTLHLGPSDGEKLSAVTGPAGLTSDTLIELLDRPRRVLQRCDARIRRPYRGDVAEEQQFRWHGARNGGQATALLGLRTIPGWEPVRADGGADEVSVVVCYNAPRSWTNAFTVAFSGPA